MKGFDAIILSAGRSSRMGRHKALLDFHGETFVRHICLLFEPFADNIVLVVSRDLYGELDKQGIVLPKTRVVINDNPALGRLYSLQTGLAHTGGKPVFMHNIDIPAIQPATIAALIEVYDDNHTVIPAYNGQKGHPILIGRNVLKVLQIAGPEQNIKNLIKSRPMKVVETGDPGIIQNINSPDDYFRLNNANSK